MKPLLNRVPVITGAKASQYELLDRVPRRWNVGRRWSGICGRVTKANFYLSKKSTTITDYHEYPDRPHLTIGVPGWEEIAACPLDWALEHAR